MISGRCCICLNGRERWGGVPLCGDVHVALISRFFFFLLCADAIYVKLKVLGGGKEVLTNSSLEGKTFEQRQLSIMG